MEMASRSRIVYTSITCVPQRDYFVRIVPCHWGKETRWHVCWLRWKTMGPRGILLASHIDLSVVCGHFLASQTDNLASNEITLACHSLVCSHESTSCIRVSPSDFDRRGKNHVEISIEEGWIMLRFRSKKGKIMLSSQREKAPVARCQSPDWRDELVDYGSRNCWQTKWGHEVINVKLIFFFVSAASPAASFFLLPVNFFALLFLFVHMIKNLRPWTAFQ